MTAGLLRAKLLAQEWAAVAERAAGGAWTFQRLKAFFSEQEIATLGSHFQAQALRSFAGALQTEADIEETDPEALTLRECPKCGCSVPVMWTPPRA